MRDDFPEGDWRAFRDLHAQALERYCAKVLSDVAAVSESAGLRSHARYLKVYELIQERNNEMAPIFDDPRRSRALMQLALMYRNGLISLDELARFSEETRTKLKSLVERHR